MSMKHALSGIITDRHRQAIHAVVDKVIADPGQQYFANLFPMRHVPAQVLIHERLSGFGGLIGERALGEKGKSVTAESRDSRLYKPGAYQEHIRFDENDILTLRKLGTYGDRGITGLTSGELDDLTRAGMKLQRRVINRWNKLGVDAIMNGTFVWKGKTFNFDVPGGNRLTAPTDWSDPSAGTPFSDLWKYQNTDPLVRLYKVKQYTINPKTATDIMVSDEAKNVLKNYNIKANDINGVAQFLFPGLAPIVVVKDAYQDESVVDGKIVLGAHTFFMPDDKVFVEIDFGGQIYSQYGEFQLTENINDPSATLERLATGLYTFVDEKGLEEREAPYVKVVTGFNGGPNLLRSDDVITISV
jgi:hypothetical protein